MSNNSKKVGAVVAAALVVAGVAGATGYAETRHDGNTNTQTKPDATAVDTHTAQHNQEQQSKALKDTGVKVETNQTPKQEVSNIGGTTVQQASQNINKLSQTNSMRDAYQRVKQVSMQKAKEQSAVIAQHKANGTQPALITEGATMYSSPKSAVVNIHSGWLNVRNESSINGFDLGKTFKGDTLTVLGHDGNWYLVQTQQGVKGFVDGQYVHFTSEGQAQQPAGSVVSPIKGGNKVVTPINGDNGNHTGHKIDTNHSKIVQPTHHTTPVVNPTKPVVNPTKPVVKPVKPDVKPDVKPAKPDVKPSNTDKGIAVSSQEAQQIVGNEFISLLNNFRHEQGLKPISVNNELQKAATWKANQMAETMILSHRDTKGQYTFNIPGYTNIKAENIAEMGLLNPNPTKADCKQLAKEIFTQWKEQLDSKDSLISPKDTLMGFAFAVGKNHHDIFFAGEFGDGSSWTNNNKPAKPVVKPVKPVEPTHHTDVKPVVKPVQPEHHNTKPDVKPVQPEHHDTKPVVEMGKATFEYQDANGVVGKEITLTGKVGDKIDVTVNVPTGYELVKTLDNGEVANYNDLTFTKAEQHLVVAIVKKEVKPVHHDTTPTSKPVVKPVVNPTPVVKPVVNPTPVVKPVVNPTPVVKPVVNPTPVVKPVKPAKPVVEMVKVTMEFETANGEVVGAPSSYEVAKGNPIDLSQMPAIPTGYKLDYVTVNGVKGVKGNYEGNTKMVFVVSKIATPAKPVVKPVTPKHNDNTPAVKPEPVKPVKPVVRPNKPVVKPVVKTGTITVKVVNENGTVIGQERTAKGDAGSIDTLTMPVAPNGYKIVSVTDNGKTIVGMPKTFTDGNQIVEVHVQKLEEPVVVKVMDGNNQLSESNTDMTIGATMGSNLMPTIPNGYHLTGVVTDGTNTGKTVNGVVQEGTNTIIVNVEKDAPKVEGMNAQSAEFKNLVEQDFDTLLAKVRAEHGSTAIPVNSTTNEVARLQANYMMVNKICSDNLSDNPSVRNIKDSANLCNAAVTTVRSNTGLTARDAQKLAESIMNMWMSSGTHAAAITTNGGTNYGFAISVSSDGSVYAAYVNAGTNMSGINWN